RSSAVAPCARGHRQGSTTFSSRSGAPASDAGAAGTRRWQAVRISATARRRRPGTPSLYRGPLLEHLGRLVGVLAFQSLFRRRGGRAGTGGAPAPIAAAPLPGPLAPPVAPRLHLARRPLHLDQQLGVAVDQPGQQALVGAVRGPVRIVGLAVGQLQQPLAALL